MRKFAVVTSISVVVMMGLLAFAQDKSTRPSQPGTASVSFADGKKVSVDYSQPKINDPKTGQPRQIMGSLVPYGKEWRTGANEATSFVTDADITVGDLKVPAGKYTLYSIPGESEWTIIINKQTGQWGTVYDDAQDLGRTKVKSGKTGSLVQEFTISFDRASGKKSNMNLEWENTKVVVPITEQ